MKKHFFFLTLAAAAMFSSCTKNEPAAGPDSVLATEISAKAITRGNIDTKAPVTGTSLNGLQADVYCNVGPWNITSTTLIDDLYAYGTMTFDDNQYVTFDKGSLGGTNGGSSQLPTNGDELYVYGYYPKGWTLTYVVTTLHNCISHTFDGKTDLMATYLKAADEVKIAYGTSSDKAELIFKHLLTRYNIQVKADNAEAQTAWGSVKSIKVKDLVDNKFEMIVSGGNVLITNDPAAPAPAFYQLKGTPATPTYSDTQFEAADFATSQALTTTFANACYTMIAPVTSIDTDKTTAELTLEVVTLDKVGGKETTTEVPLSFDRTKFPADADGLNAGNTRGYSITITLNFRSGAIQAIASVEEWKDGGQLDENVDNTTPNTVKVGDLKDGGIVYWVDATDAKLYRIVSLDEKSLKPSTNDALDPRDEITTTNENDGRITLSGLKRFATSKSVDYATTYPASAWCESKGAGWYQPALNELFEIYQVWTTNATFKTAMGTKGTQFNTSTYPSSSWWDNPGSPYRYVDFTDGSKNHLLFQTTPGLIRCVKSTTPTIGDLKDGGIVYEVTDATHYKVCALEEPNLKWAAQDTYVLGAAGQNETDGKKNVAAMQAYSAAHTGDSDNTTKTTGVFATDFPAAAFCEAKNTGGVAGWYLPAKDELTAFYTAYKANKTVLDAAITANSGTAMASGTFWSSTEYSNSASNAWSVNFSNGFTGVNGKGNTRYVRCVRDL